MKFKQLRFATAEGLNALAVLRDSLTSDPGRSLIRFEFDEASSGLAQAVGFSRLAEAPPVTGVQPLARLSAQAWGCGPFLCDVTGQEDVLDVARNIAESASLAASEWGHDEKSDFHDTVERIALEAIFNVHEHAFGRNAPRRPAFICITVQSAAGSLSAAEHQSIEEKKWLAEQGNRLLLEVAISDSGRGVPQTLWLKTRERMPELFGVVSQLSSGTNKFDRARADLHAHLCADAFHHDSTCKSREDFVDVYHEMNWRGLYRGRQQVAEFGGFIALASGRGRAGFAVVEGQAREFSYALPSGNDLPGTTVVVRLPLPLARRSLSPEPRRATHEEQQAAATIHPELIAWSKFEAAWPGQRLVITPTTGEPAVAGAVFRFCEITSDHHLLQRGDVSIPVSRVLAALKHLPPDVVPVLFFAELGREKLRACGPGWTPLSGYLRLAAFWEPRQRQLAWRVAGVFPAETQDMLDTLEHDGHYFIRAGAPGKVTALARELAVNYRHFVAFEAGTGLVQLTQFAAQVPDEVERRAFDLAFAECWPELRASVVKEDPNRAVLLHTGTRVRRYLCILYLVESSPVLAQTLGWHLVKAIGDAELVTDDHGSSFVAQTLLRNQPGRLKPIGRLRALELPHGSDVIIFVDAIFKARTVSHFAKALAGRGLRVRGVVTCADLRKPPVGSVGDGIPVTSLMRIPDFDPEELGPAPEGVNDVQIDRVTHVPVEAEASQFVSICTSHGAERLMEIEPHMFDHGFHERGERLHTFTLPSRRLLDLHETEALECIIEKLKPFLERHGGPNTDVILFHRSDSEIGRYLGPLHDMLAARRLVALGHVFRVSIPTEHRGAKSVFAHADTPLFTECRLVETGQLSLLAGERPSGFSSGQFLAIYVDDAAVSGKALRSFMHRVMRDPKQQPRAVMGLVLVNRLSPAELRAFALSRQLWSPGGDNSGHGVPFEFDCVYRLQIRSLELGTALDHPLLRRIRESGPIPTRELRAYFHAITSRLTAEYPVRHVFLTDSGPEAPRPMPHDAVLLRHLLALHQQNETVTAEILRTWAGLNERRDPALLHLLALEPDLLDEPPFNGICRHDTITLCLDTLLAPNANRADKSDGLVVLAWYENAFFDSLRQVAPAILCDETLRLQLLLFILTIFTRSEEQYHCVMDALGALPPAAGVGAWAHSARDLIARSHRFRQTLGAVHSEDDAELRLREIVGRMLRHSKDVEDHWESLANQLMTMRADWDQFADESARDQVLQAMPRALKLAAEVFLPAFPALVALSELRGDDSLSGQLRDAEEKAARLCAALTALVPSSFEDVTPDRVTALSENLEALRAETWAGGWATNDVLSQMDLGSQVAPLCRGLREFYCAPWAIFSRLADETRAKMGAARVPAAPESSILVCRVPVLEMHDIFRPLLNNVCVHGDIGSLTIAKRDTEPPLVIEFRDRIKNPETVGGTGIALATAKASPFKVRILSAPSIDDSLVWRTEIFFPHFFRADEVLSPLRKP